MRTINPEDESHLRQLVALLRERANVMRVNHERVGRQLDAMPAEAPLARARLNRAHTAFGIAKRDMAELADALRILGDWNE